jgi:hypothetical protein
MATATREAVRMFVRSCAMAEIDLALVGRPLERLINDVAGLKDDMSVVLARLDRIDETSH